ncbi:diguanylate cyclase domain-containing protein [Aliivibrio sifiae]|uniref:Diguanylate cyclase n=1 Tax=Aliivibrio sifiae TaxID=566293 RepID=A0A2S7X6Q2_9GAMM|nr:diguanylate cyclase [Aliivibrio sifiae]PQJ86832.1 diguanylate cyclase [Aliivibrio sifiae]GLR74050.1 diguanylate cyclase [Aliivibrio sifiae]
MNVRLKLALFLLVLFSISIVGSILTFKLESYGDEKLAWVIHTHNVITDSEKLLSSMKDAETGQRGYLLTQEITYLEPYYTGMSNAQKMFQELRLLTKDTPEQQAALDNIDKSMKLKFDELALTVELTQYDNLSQALKVVKEDRGKDYMDSLRADLTQFINIEMILLEKRKGDFKENRTQLVTLIKMQIVVLIFLAIATISFMKRNLFDPLNLLLSSTKKMQQGEKLEIADVVEKNEMGNLLAAFFKMNEVVHEKAEVLAYKAHHDELTGLQNRSMVNTELQCAIHHGEKTNTKVAVYFLDLNKFKEINDSLGHDIGDQVLIKTSQLLAETIRSKDKVFRLGGDEFLVIGQDISQHSGIKKLTSKLLEQFKFPVIINETSMLISPSIGVAIYPDDSVKGEELIKFADIAMYEAKKEQGNSCCEFAPSMLKRDVDQPLNIHK